MPDECAICGAELEDRQGRCARCGAPADVGDRSETGVRSECPECGRVIWSLAERCPHCDARGYPALRPRFGDKSLKSPGTEGADGQGADG